MTKKERRNTVEKGYNPPPARERLPGNTSYNPPSKPGKPIITPAPPPKKSK